MAAAAAALDWTKPAVIQGFLQYVNASPSPFHAVAASSALLEAGGFVRISEKNTQDLANIQPNGKYYFTRNQSSICAFAVGGQWKPGQGLTMCAAHTDSPNFRVKPKSKVQKQGFLQVGVECYGGGLWYTWFDRDLSVAGRVIVANEDETKFESKLVRIDRPILKIPSLAIHLNRAVNDEGFKPNKETHTVPILSTVEKALSVETAASVVDDKHHPLLLKLLADELGVDASRIRDFELSLFDLQPAVLGGALNEFIFSARLDNLLMSYISLSSLLNSAQSDSLASDSNIRLVALFDHEECGSGSAQGAASSLLQTLITRLNRGVDVDASIHRSFLVSADMAHGIHPNYPEKHEDGHRPMLHKGLVFKENSNQKYASNAVTTFLLSEIARRHKVPVQDFCVRNDALCGSTVGPILAANCGVRTVDVGVPQFSMHSIRETCGTEDVYSSFVLLSAYFNEFSKVDASLSVDL